MNAGLRRFARSLLPPRALHAYRMLRHTVLVPFERELTVMPGYLSAEAVAVDVGANVGLYTTVMGRHAARVLAFEPHPACAAHLRSLRLDRCEVVEAALSDVDGKAILRVPREGHGEHPALGTLATSNKLGGQPESNVHAIPVATLRLDTALAGRVAPTETIGFIKIDVEGNEGAVLQGATACIARHRPVLLVEMESRHGSDIGAIFTMLGSLGYRALALVGNGALQPVGAERLRDLQSPERLAQKLARPRDSGYVNNVFFLPPNR